MATTAKDDHAASGPQGLVHALRLNGDGGAIRLGWEEVRRWQPGDGVLWLHFDYSVPSARDWILHESGLDEVSAAALLAAETRPRLMLIGDAALLALRGINLNPDADPDDMVAARVWADAHRVITTRRRKLLSFADVARTLEAGQGPCNSGEVVVSLVAQLTARAEDTLADLSDRVDALEEAVFADPDSASRSALAEARREAITLRRYLAPQKDAVTRLCTERIAWLDDQDRLSLREIADRLIRYVEDLDAIRDRAVAAQDELGGHLSAQLNARMYVLSLLTAVFLPLGFLTGLFGVNLGGLPGSGDASAFLVFATCLVVLVAAQVWLFKRYRWL